MYPIITTIDKFINCESHAILMPTNILATQSLALLLATSILSSCAHHINYELSGSDVWLGPELNETLEIGTFKDDAPKDQKIEVDLKGESWRINAREGYPGDGSLSKPVENMIGAHFAHSGLFKDVFYGDSRPDAGQTADYTLSGTIYDYHGMGKANREAEMAVVMATTVGNLPGAAAGMVATQEQTSEVQSKVRLNRLRLKDNRTGRIVWSKQTLVSGSQRDEHFLYADNDGVFLLADHELRNVVNDMIYEIGKSRTGSRPKRPSKKELGTITLLPVSIDTSGDSSDSVSGKSTTSAPGYPSR